MVRHSLLSSAFTLYCAILNFVISLTLPVQLFLLRPLPLFPSTLPSNTNFCKGMMPSYMSIIGQFLFLDTQNKFCIFRPIIFNTSALLFISFQDILMILRYDHTSKTSILASICFDRVHVSQAYANSDHTYHLVSLSLVFKDIFLFVRKKNMSRPTKLLW